MRTKSKSKAKTTRPCDYPGCDGAGEYRAPKDRTLRDYYWFCLRHVKEYNKNWDFLKGLSADEIEEHLQNDTKWQRPTWKLGHGGIPPHASVHDPLHIRSAGGLGMDGKYNPPPKAVPLEKKTRAALDVMGLNMPLTLTTLKKQFKKMAKECHPDLNKGDRESERRFKKLNEAYHYLLEKLTLS